MMRMTTVLFGNAGRVRSFVKCNHSFLVFNRKAKIKWANLHGLTSQSVSYSARKTDCLNGHVPLSYKSTGKSIVLWEIRQTIQSKRQKAKQFNHIASRLAHPKCPPSKWVESCTQFVWTERSFIKFHSTAVRPVLSDNLKKANAFNDVFINQNTSTALENFPVGPTTTESLFSVQTVTASEVKSVRMLKSLPSKISTGVDNISYRLLKEAGPGSWTSLTCITPISHAAILIQWRDFSSRSFHD